MERKGRREEVETYTDEDDVFGGHVGAGRVRAADGGVVG